MYLFFYTIIPKMHIRSVCNRYYTDSIKSYIIIVLLTIIPDYHTIFYWCGLFKIRWIILDCIQELLFTFIWNYSHLHSINKSIFRMLSCRDAQTGAHGPPCHSWKVEKLHFRTTPQNCKLNIDNKIKIDIYLI